MSRVKSRSQPPAANQKSLALVDTAEELVETLERLSVCLRHVEEKYVEKDGNIDKSSSLFNKMKENLETARDLMDSLKQEKWRLSRREMSVELRMGELEEYKSHMKRDMTDMNQTVEVLSMRVVQLENALCEEQEKQETMEAEKNEALESLMDQQKKAKGLEDDIASLQSEIQSLKLQRTDSQLRKTSDDMTNKMEVLILENRSLKEMIREREEEEAKLKKELELEKQENRRNRDSLSDQNSVTSAMNNLGLTRDTEIEYV